MPDLRRLNLIGNYKDRGAFAEYAKADSDLVWKFSTNAVSFEQAATMNCA